MIIPRPLSLSDSGLRIIRDGASGLPVQWASRFLAETRTIPTVALDGDGRRAAIPTVTDFDLRCAIGYAPAKVERAA